MDAKGWWWTADGHRRSVLRILTPKAVDFSYLDGQDCFFPFMLDVRLQLLGFKSVLWFQLIRRKGFGILRWWTSEMFLENWFIFSFALRLVEVLLWELHVPIHRWNSRVVESTRIVVLRKEQSFFVLHAIWSPNFWFLMVINTALSLLSPSLLI